jgi:anti-sigma regulatory factor (Ser/Thr protein kinase)
VDRPNGSMEGELCLAAHPSELTRAREFADQAARAFRFDDDGRYQFKFAASEAVANAIEHGMPSSDGKIELRLVGEGDTLTLYVRDYGTFEADSPPPRDLPERGRGLAFMVSLMDEVEVKTEIDGTVIRLAKRRRPGSPAPAVGTPLKTAAA